MRNILKNQSRWLLPAVLILFIAEIFTLPLVMHFTYAGRSEAPDRVLTYTPGKLTWNDGADAMKNGAARLSLFNSRYDKTVNAQNGENVIAPGTGGANIVRLKNNAGKRVEYTAVLYEIKDNPELPVKARLRGNGFADTKNYALPDSAENAGVIRAVTGKIGSGEIQDFDIDWQWKYYEDKSQDISDTLLGDKAAFKNADDITVGLYIVVNDENSYITPKPPKTGDIGAGMFIALIVISGALLILLAVSKAKEKKCGE